LPIPLRSYGSGRFCVFQIAGCLLQPIAAHVWHAPDAGALTGRLRLPFASGFDSTPAKRSLPSAGFQACRPRHPLPGRSYQARGGVVLQIAVRPQTPIKHRSSQSTNPSSQGFLPSGAAARLDAMAQVRTVRSTRRAALATPGRFAYREPDAPASHRACNFD